MNRINSEKRSFAKADRNSIGLIVVMTCIGILANANTLSASDDENGSSDNSTSGLVQVELKTTMGAIVLELDRVRAPLTVQNFLKYVQSGHYKQTLIHRTINDFMIQGGGRDPSLKSKPAEAPPVRNEAGNGLANDEYTVAMARKPDPHSATDQFFINTGKNNGFLNRSEADDGFGYTVFGRVVSGQKVVDQIESVPTQSISDPDFPPRLMTDVPVDPIVIEDVVILSK